MLRSSIYAVRGNWNIIRLCVFCSVVSAPLFAAADDRPNLVFFLVDDMGWQDTSEPFHTETTPLNKRYQTPNIQKLARQGMKFTQAYACAVCSPTRVSLMTGLNAARHMVTNWTLRKNKSPDPHSAIIDPPPWNLNGLSPTSGVDRTVCHVTLPALLKDSGYRTIHIGKAHFGARGTPGEAPQNLGFDLNIAGHAAGGPGSYHGIHNFSAAWRNGDRIWDVPDLDEYHGQEINLTEALTIEAKRAIDEAVADQEPFYLYMSHYAVHAPWEEDERFYDEYIEAGLEGHAAKYASMIEGMDKSLGDIIDHLEALGISQQTVVIFMSDNGCPKQLPPNLPLRGHKLTPYEGGVRVPLIVKWPGVVPPGSKCTNHYVIIEDLFPTLLTMAGLQLPQQNELVVDGVSFVPLLKGGSEFPENRPIYWHFPHTYDQPAYSSMRQGDWKLIYHHASRQLELFNLAQDIGESRDLANIEPGQMRQLAQTLSTHLRQTKAMMPTDKRTGKKVEYPDELAN